MITPDNKFLWNDHSKDIPDGTHAIIGASKYAWVNYDRESLENSVVSYYSPAIGTILHGLVSKLVRTKIKVNRTEARKLISESKYKKQIMYCTNDVNKKM